MLLPRRYTIRIGVFCCVLVLSAMLAYGAGMLAAQAQRGHGPDHRPADGLEPGARVTAG